MRNAIYPGSFDPPTLGHLDIIQRASKLFDKVTVCVMINHNKKPMFTAEERVELLKLCTNTIGNVEVISSSGLLADLFNEIPDAVVVKGIRNSSDFDHELSMAILNKKLNPNFETILLPTNLEYLHISSSNVRAVMSLNGELSGFVPAEILERLRGK